MSDGFVLLSIAFILMIIPICIQYLIFRFAKSLIVKLLPVILFIPIWLVCVLGAYNILDLPVTSSMMDGGFIAFHDTDVIAAAGVPVVIGLIICWIVYILIYVCKKSKNNNA